MKKNHPYHYTFLRHAESTFNRDGHSGADPSLSPAGIEKAKTLRGHYDYALVSCMQRTRETLEFSELVCDSIEVSSLCREAMDKEPNLMNGESEMEDDDDFERRVAMLKQFLREKGKKYDRILIITHFGVISSITSEQLDNGATIGVDKL